MSIADKLQQIKDNIPRVYNGGLNAERLPIISFEKTMVTTDPDGKVVAVTESVTGTYISTNCHSPASSIQNYLFLKINLNNNLSLKDTERVIFDFLAGSTGTWAASNKIYIEKVDKIPEIGESISDDGKNDTFSRFATGCGIFGLTGDSEVYFHKIGIDITTYYQQVISNENNNSTLILKLYGWYRDTDRPVGAVRIKNSDSDFIFRISQKNSIDTLQNYGNRTHYAYVFAFGSGTNSYFLETKYPIFCTSENYGTSAGNSLFRQPTSGTNKFKDLITKINKSIIITVSDAQYVFDQCKSLTEISDLVVTKSTTFKFWFRGCTSLTDITWRGSIANDLDLHDCTYLNKSSIRSTIEHLDSTKNSQTQEYNTQGKTISLSKSAVQNAFNITITIDEEDNVIIEGKDGNTNGKTEYLDLLKSKPNWTFAYGANLFS